MLMQITKVSRLAGHRHPLVHRVQEAGIVVLRVSFHYVPQMLIPLRIFLYFLR